MAAGLNAQVVKAPRYQSPVDAPAQQLNLPPLPPAITPHGTVVEDIVVRVNDQIISRSDIERQQQQLNDAVAQGTIPKDQLATEQKNMLRDMIDQQLLLSRAKEQGLNADNEVIRQLDDIRKKNNFASMDDLERAVKKEGINFEDFKAQDSQPVPDPDGGSRRGGPPPAAYPGRSHEVLPGSPAGLPAAGADSPERNSDSHPGERHAGADCAGAGEGRRRHARN